MSERLDCTALAHGVWRIALPFPSPLGHSFSYLVRSSEGFVAIDTGWDCDDGWSDFLRGLDRAGLALHELRGVVVTHAHPDHYGLTRRIAQETDAWIALHPADEIHLAPRPEDRAARVDALESWMRECGVPAAQVESMLADRSELLTELSPNLPTLHVTDRTVVPQSDGALSVIHTPGHTPGHVVVLDRSRDILFTGDHLLPRVSANVSKRPTSGSDPLGDYVTSLTKLPAATTTLAAPGHEWTFDRVDQRVAVSLEHHASRLAEVRRAVEAGAATVYEVAIHVTWSRPFESLNPRGRRSALGEAYAHLERLVRTGQLTRRAARPGSPHRWTHEERGPSHTER